LWASANRCSRSAGESASAACNRSRTSLDTLTLRPCSSQVYQATPTPASCATSSRREAGHPPLTNGRDADRSRFGSGAHGPKEFTQGSAGGVRWGIARTLSSRAHSLSGWLALTAPSISVRDAERRGPAGPSLGEVRPSGPSLKLLALADAKGVDAIL